MEGSAVSQEGNREDGRVTTIHLWCGPRSLSTATLYSFAQRSDTIAFDEPLYASYIAKNPILYRPYRDELLVAQDNDGNAVLRALSTGRGSPLFKTNSLGDKSVVFAKHICKQIVGLDTSLIVGKHIRNVFLIRDPLAMISSWGAKDAIHQEACSLQTMGLPNLLQTFSEIRQATGEDPIVIDSDLLQQYPREMLNALCKRLDIPFLEEQLTWPAGPKAVDGLWAAHWYDNVHKSTGFGSFATDKAVKKQQPLSKAEVDLYREALSFYDTLRRHAIGVDRLSPGTSLRSLYLPDSQVETRLADPRNVDVLVWVGDRLMPRELAKVSAFDSAVQGGDAVWEGLRVYDRGVFMLDTHLDRLANSAKAMAFAHIPSKEYIKEAVKRTLIANGMYDGCHIRLTLTRGAKLSSSMNPKFNVFGSNLIVLAEWKPVGDPATYNNQAGIMLITASNRRNPPQCLDSKIHHCNLMNNILPKIQANVTGAADALMLDVDGFVSETNATNVFAVKDGVIYTPHADSCLPGVTRSLVIKIVRDELRLPMVEKRVSLFEFHTADEVFTTGTMGEITPVTVIDGRSIGATGLPGPITADVQRVYTLWTQEKLERILA